MKKKIKNSTLKLGKNTISTLTNLRAADMLKFQGGKIIDGGTTLGDRCLFRTSF